MKRLLVVVTMIVGCGNPDTRIDILTRRINIQEDEIESIKQIIKQQIIEQQPVERHGETRGLPYQVGEARGRNYDFQDRIGKAR